MRRRADKRFVDSALGFSDHIGMDDDGPLRPPDPLTLVTRQPLEPLSVAELDARVLVLEAEITRVRAHRQHAVNHKATAEGLFKKG